MPDIIKVSELKRAGMFWMLYAAGGGGKTTLAGTIANSVYAQPTVLLDIDRSSFVLAHRSDIDVVLVKDWPHFEANIADIMKTNNYKGIIVDNVVDLADTNLEYQRKTVGSKDDRQHYSAMTSSMLSLVKRLRDRAQINNMTIILTAWEGEQEERFTSNKLSMAFNPALQRRIHGVLTTIGYLDVDDDEVRTLHLGSNRKLVTKFRRAPIDEAMLIPKRIINPDLGPIVDTLIAGIPFPSVFSSDSEATKLNLKDSTDAED